MMLVLAVPVTVFAVTSSSSPPARESVPESRPAAESPAADDGLAAFDSVDAPPISFGGAAPPTTPPSPPGEDRPPIHEPFRSFSLGCDVRSSGTNNYLVTTNLGPEYRSLPYTQSWGRFGTEAFSADDHRSLWNRSDLSDWHSDLFDPMAHLFKLEGYERPLPYPANWGPMPNALPAGDLNSDGTCDAIMYGLRAQRPDTLVCQYLSRWTGCPDLITAEVRAVDGATGATLWNHTWRHGPDALGVTVFNSTRGVQYFDSPAGPRLVVLMTDSFNPMPCVDDEDNSCGLLPPKDNLFMVTDHVYVFDATDGDLVWEHVVNPLPFTLVHDSFNVTRITGVADLNHDGSPEVVLDRDVVYRRHDRCWAYYAHNGPYNPLGTDCSDPRPPPKFPGVWVMALDGNSGGVLWDTEVVASGSISTKSQSVEGEEMCEQIDSDLSRLVTDVTGDNASDVVALYYTRAVSCDATGTNEDSGTSVNGRSLIHVVPLDGATGRRLWDVKLQGFGYADSLTPTGAAAVPFVAVGAVDTASFVAPGARFPEKEVRLTVLRLKDGGVVWSYRDQFSQDSYLTSFFALLQFHSTLAPYDWTGDGVKELVTPPHYTPPTRDDQVLLSTANQTFRVIDGRSGATHRSLTTWGSVGMVVACPGAEANLTLLAGHARRLDLFRVDVEGVRVEWRTPIWFDPRIYPVTISIDLTGFSLVSGLDERGRTFFGANLATFSFYRGRSLETFPQFGFVEPDGRLAWIEPSLMRLFGLPPDKAVLQAAQPVSAGADVLAPAWAKATAGGSVALIGAGGGAILRLKRRRNA